MEKKKGNTLKIVPIKATKLEKIFIKLGFQSRHESKARNSNLTRMVFH